MHGFAKAIILTTVLSLLFSSVSSSQHEGKDVVIGKMISFHSEIYDKEIELFISLPYGYERTEKDYSVFYSLHSRYEHTAVTINDLSRGQIPPMIYVYLATYNSGDLIPTKIDERPDSGNIGRLLSFFEEELFPFVESNYRTEKYRIIQSGSWGGIFCLYTLLTQPDLFNAYIASTPWFIYDEDKRYILRHAENLLTSQNFKHNFLFMTIGNDPVEGLHESFDEFTSILNVNPKEGLKYRSISWPDEDHYSIGHKSVWDGLKWIFKDWNELPEEILDKGIPGIEKYGSELDEIFGYNIGINPSPVWRYAWNLMGQSKFSDAIEYFNHHVSLLPNEPHSYEGLGRAYEAAEEFELAMRSFEEALKIAEKNSHPDLPRFNDHITRIKKN